MKWQFKMLSLILQLCNDKGHFIIKPIILFLHVILFSTNIAFLSELGQETDKVQEKMGNL